jgi:tetratricopeptide (TPR) repeat protein
MLYPEGDHASELAHLGLIAQETLDLPAARRYLQQAYDQARQAGDSWLNAFVANYLADVLRELGELQSATRLAQESLRIFTELEDSHFQPDAHLTLAQIALAEGEYRDGRFSGSAGLWALCGAGGCHYDGVGLVGAGGVGLGKQTTRKKRRLYWPGRGRCARQRNGPCLRTNRCST